MVPDLLRVVRVLVVVFGLFRGSQITPDDAPLVAARFELLDTDHVFHAALCGFSSAPPSADA